MKKKIIAFLMLMIFVFVLTSCVPELFEKPQEINENGEHTLKEEKHQKIEEDGKYTSKEEVALYIHTFAKLPSNYITKKDAQDKGWDSSKGNLWDITDEMSIGGDVFSNREGILPKQKGRKYFECDINYEGGYRGSERIVFSNDGLIFYTNDHYKTFEQLY